MAVAFTLGLALIPGRAEALEQAGHSDGNMAWAGYGMGLKVMRNTLYASVALAALSGSAYYYTGRVTALGITLLSSGMAGLSGYRLSTIAYDVYCIALTRLADGSF